MILTVPLPPNAANSRRHWRVALRDKQEYWDALAFRRAARMIPVEPKEPYDPAHIAVTLYLHSPMDHDNAMHRCKILVDWLVRSGYIGDDSPSRLKWAGLPEQVIDRKNPRVVLEIKSIAE